jgi:uncharacterized protein involved in exopolysaccharide biosynthesis
LVKGKKPESSAAEGIVEGSPRFFELTKEDLFSDMQILTSPDVILKTIKSLEERNLYFNPHEKKATTLGMLSKYLREYLFPKRKTDSAYDERVFGIKEKIKAEPLPVSNVIGITCYDKDPANAAVLLSTLMDQYVIYRTQVYNPSDEEVFFSIQAENFKKNLEEREDELIALVNNTKVTDPQKEIDNNMLIKNELGRNLQALKSDEIEKKLYVEHLKNTINTEDIQYFSFIENNLPLSNLGINIQKLYIDWKNILKNYQPDAKNAEELEAEISDLSSALKAEVSSYMKNQENQLKIIRSKIKRIEARNRMFAKVNIELHDQVIASQRISRESNLLKLSYDIFSKKREEARMNRDINPSMRYISILSKAFPSFTPVFPQAIKVIPFGIIIGFILGCSFAFVREYFDHTFKKPRDVEVYIDLPVLSSIPVLAEYLEGSFAKKVGGANVVNYKNTCYGQPSQVKKLPSNGIKKTRKKSVLSGIKKTRKKSEA